MESLARVCGWITLSAALLAAPALALAGTQEVEWELDVTPGGTLTIALHRIEGELDIEGWDQDRITITGKMRGSGWRDDDRLEFEQSSSGVDVYPTGRFDEDDVEARLTIKVPREYGLEIDAYTETSIFNLNGGLKLAIANADLEVSGAQGEARISTANGRLRIDDSTLSGRIANTNGRLTIRDSDIDGEVTSTNSSLSVSRAPEGIEVSSTNGNIEVDTAADHVRARTTNGQITIGELDGWIDAQTVNGSVSVRMVGDGTGRRSIDIETVNGSVDLEIPASFSLDFDIEVKNDGNDDRFEIVSDFDLEIEEKQSRRDRYRIRGRGSIGGGDNEVRIRATNGDVRLRRVEGSD